MITRIIYKLVSVSTLLTASVACTYEIVEEPDNIIIDGEDMSYAKSATGTLVSGGSNVVQVQDNFDGKAQNFTVQFWLGQRTQLAGPTVGVFTPVAEILWSIGGNTQRRLVSIFDGTAITGVAEHFTIRATDQTIAALAVIPTQYDVSIIVAHGVRGSTALPPTYLTYITSTGAGIAFGRLILLPQETLLVPIPADVGVNSVMVTGVNVGNSAVPIGVDFNFAQTYLPVFDLKRYNPLNYNFVTISPQANNLLFQNLRPLIGGTPMEFSVTWGIDG